MDEGLSFNMVLSGATLVSVLGLILKIWLSGRSQKIEQPLSIQSTLCDRQIKDNKDDHTNIFLRLTFLERRDGRVEGEIKQINESVKEIKSMLNHKLHGERLNNEG